MVEKSLETSINYCGTLDEIIYMQEAIGMLPRGTIRYTERDEPLILHLKVELKKDPKTTYISSPFLDLRVNFPSEAKNCSACSDGSNFTLGEYNYYIKHNKRETKH